MSKKSILNLPRRNFFKASAGLAGAFVATRGFAQICEVPTAEQPLGPFFPRPGTPLDIIQEDTSPTTPIYLANDSDLTQVKGRPGAASGQVVYVKGQVLNENCLPLPNATIIIWQASETGRYNHTGDAANESFIDPRTAEIIHRLHDPAFQYWGKATTNAKGEYLFKTIVPGFYPADLSSKWYRPPHIHFMVSATGYPQLVTQMYFHSPEINDNDWIQELNQQDLILQSSNVSAEERKNLVVSFERGLLPGDPQALTGIFNINMKR